MKGEGNDRDLLKSGGLAGGSDIFSDRSDQFLTLGNPLIVAARELKSPLILMRQLSLEFTDSLENSKKSVREDSAEIAKKIRLTSERSLRLADSLLRAARLEDALFELEPMRIDGVIREAADGMEPLALALGSRISRKTPRKMPPVIANRDLLCALIANLLDNSLSQNNGGKKVEISAKIESGFAKIFVRDHGSVISLGEFRRIRENLDQEQPISSRPNSSALCLAVSGMFAKKMNGRLDAIRPRRGDGIAFQISLPITQQASLLELL